jgi:hypothetical protein
MLQTFAKVKHYQKAALAGPCTWPFPLVYNH